MAKILYYWDQDKHFDHSEFFQNDEDVPNPLPDNATAVAPVNGLYEPLTWNGASWDGTPKEDWLAAHPTPAPEPTSEQKTIMQQATDISQMKQMMMMQASQIATLTKGDAK